MRTALLTLATVSLALVVWIGLSVMMPLVDDYTDSDGDGIPNHIDLHPFDRDNDGIKDRWDLFPDYDAALRVDLDSIVFYSKPFDLDVLTIKVMITVNDNLTILGAENPLQVSTMNDAHLNLGFEVDIPDDVPEGTLSFAVLAIHPEDESSNRYLNLNPDSEKDNVSYVFQASPELHKSDSTLFGGDGEDIESSLNFTIRAVALSIDQTLTWKFEGSFYEVDLNIKMHEFYFYRSHDIPRHYTTEAAVRTFITAEDAIIDHLAREAEQLFQHDWTAYQKAGLILAMVQSLKYAPDNETSAFEEYWSFPVETLFRGNGDCEDSSFLLASLYKNLEFQSKILIFFPTDDSVTEGHMAVAVAIPGYEGPYSALNGSYYYAETTGRLWKIGEIPLGYNRESITVPV